MKGGPNKSVITCDREGRIETFNRGAESLFGYRADEVVGRRRVSLFSPGLVVLGPLPRWLERARRDGAFETRTVFVHKDGAPFTADIRITPTYRRGEHIGYCGVTVPRPEVPPAEAWPEIGVWPRVLRWLVVTRAPFLSATWIPILAAAAWVAYRGGGSLSWAALGLVLLGATGLHIAANTFNDFFDWKSGADPENNDYFQALSGGSRAIELGLVTERGLVALGCAGLGVAAASGVLLLKESGLGLLGFGLVGAFSAYFYTAPPLRLVARRGLGELTVALCFGPLMTAGTAYALTGGADVQSALIGLPVGLLTAAILWVNEFPDAAADARAGKNHLVVVLGRRAARWGYLALVAAAFASVALLAAIGIAPAGALFALLSLPLAARAVWLVLRHYEDRELSRACAATIQLHAAAGLLFAAGIAAAALGWMG